MGHTTYQLKKKLYDDIGRVVKQWKVK